MHDSLTDKHSVERIPMQLRQTPELEGGFFIERKRIDAVL